MDVLNVSIFVIILAVVWLYGQIRYTEGKMRGLGEGSVTVWSLMLAYFKDKKVVDVDEAGTIFRLKDDGLRGESIMVVEPNPTTHKIKINT